MAKTIEELNAIKEEIETLNKKLAELTEEELAQVSGGIAHGREEGKKGYDVAIFTGIPGFP